jgi:hypothetical protein
MAGCFAAAVLLLGLATGLFRLLVPSLPQYERQIENFASDTLKVPVTLGSYDCAGASADRSSSSSTRSCGRPIAASACCTPTAAPSN